MITMPATVSPDIQLTLEQMANTPMENCKEEVASFVGNWKLLSEYDLCLWWDGCYYCRSSEGTWEQIKCYI
ncbi:MAG: hypothetical protein OHK0012_03920 [Synechococcales cyanobacterium]